MGGMLPPLSTTELAKALQERQQEFAAAVSQTIPLALARLQDEPLLPPKEVELSGIFCFAHRLDGTERWLEQENRCSQARDRLLAGEDFALVAAQVSQDATRELGGRLGPRFLDPLEPLDQQLARLRPREISPVFEVDNGFWCFRLDQKRAGKPQPFSDLPWEAKRILLRQALHRLMAVADPGRPLAMISPFTMYR
ncbi:MAG: peptidyl-prolyl cis-trans isomerase [Thermodesulfobacteriota bacterium]